MRKSRFVLLVIVVIAILTTPLTVYAQATTPAANPVPATTPSAISVPLTIFTNYPAQVVGIGETATIGMLNPAVRSFGLLLPSQMAGAIMGALLGESVLLIWPLRA